MKVVPIRSAQAVHTSLARRFRGKTIVEIGTRNGDGMHCFAQAARHATAIEMDKRYCAKLTSRSASLRAEQRYDVACKSYDRVASKTFHDADYVTWWVTGLKFNAQALSHLVGMRDQLRPDAEAVVLHDLKTGVDNASYDVLGPVASWVEEVKVPPRECALCMHAVRDGQLKPDRWASCGRATGTVLVLGFRLRSPELADRLSRLGKAQLRSRTGVDRANWPASCVQEHGRVE